MHYIDEQSRDVACVKSVKPDSVAEASGTVQSGMLLGYIQNAWVKDQDYFTQIKQIRECRPVKLGFCGNVSAGSMPDPTPAAPTAAPDAELAPVREEEEGAPPVPSLSVHARLS
jgi:hypothetical protein